MHRALVPHKRHRQGAGAGAGQAGPGGAAGLALRGAARLHPRVARAARAARLRRAAEAPQAEQLQGQAAGHLRSRGRRQALCGVHAHDGATVHAALVVAVVVQALLQVLTGQLAVRGVGSGGFGGKVGDAGGGVQILVDLLQQHVGAGVEQWA